MTQILMYCEGVRDFMPLCSLMKKTANTKDFKVTRKTRNDLRKETSLLSGRRGIHKHITDIDRLAMSAKKANCKHIAYHQDGNGEFIDIYESIEKKFSDYKEKLNCLAIVPKEMTESWLLSDKQAFAIAFGSIPSRPKLPGKPEMLWGALEDPDSNYPKHVLERVLNQYNITANRDVYDDIAQNCDIDTLILKCPKSFATFVRDVRSFLT